MSDITYELETTKLEKYLNKEGREDIVAEIRGASPDALDAKLLGIAKHNEEIENTKQKDTKLSDAKTEVRVLGATYREQKRMNAKIARFIALVMQERGVDLAPARPATKDDSNEASS
jgi:hypothetical protein